MHSRLAHELARTPALLSQVADRAGRLVAGVGERPVVRREPPQDGADQGAGASRLPAVGAGTEGAWEEFARRWEPGFSASAGPRYLGFVTGGATPAALAGDWLASALDQNVVTGLDSTAPELERETVGRLRELFGLPEAHTGAFVSGATLSNTVGLALAREWVGERRGVSVAEQGVAALGSPVTVLSGAPHSSIGKALSVLGLGRGALREVGVVPGREAVDVERLDAALEALGGEPAVVVANAGTVNTGDFDDLAALAALRARHPFWLHVDAAFGGFAALSPEHAPLTEALGEADSVCVDLHKWLNVPYDSAVQFTRHRALQTRVFQNAAAYLGPLGDEPDFVHLTPENSRRLRALPAWFSLAAYGREGHAEIVRRDIALARRLGERLAALPGFRVLAPVRLNVVCFTLADTGAGAESDPGAAQLGARLGALTEAVTRSGEAFLTPTVYAGVPALRAAFSNWRTTAADADRVADALARALAGLGGPAGANSPTE